MLETPVGEPTSESSCSGLGLIVFNFNEVISDEILEVRICSVDLSSQASLGSRLGLEYKIRKSLITWSSGIAALLRRPHGVWKNK